MTETQKRWKKNNIKTRKINFYISNEKDKELYEYSKTINFQKFIKHDLKIQKDFEYTRPDIVRALDLFRCLNVEQFIDKARKYMDMYIMLLECLVNVTGDEDLQYDTHDILDKAYNIACNTEVLYSKYIAGGYEE